MKTIISLCAAGALSLAGLGIVGCQDHDRDQRPSGADYSGSYGASTASGHVYAPAGQASGGRAGVPDNVHEDASLSRPQGGDPLRYGNKEHSGTLSGGSVSDPNANTMGGGQ